MTNLHIFCILTRIPKYLIQY